MTTNNSQKKKFVYVDKEHEYTQNCKNTVLPAKLRYRLAKQDKIISQCANKGLGAVVTIANIPITTYSISFQNDETIINKLKWAINSYDGPKWRNKRRISTLTGYDINEVKIYDTQEKFNILAINTVANQRRGRELDAMFISKYIESVETELNALFYEYGINQDDIKQYGNLIFLDELLTSKIRFDWSRQTQLVKSAVLRKISKYLTNECVTLKSIFNDIKQKNNEFTDSQFAAECIKRCKELLREKEQKLGVNPKKHKMDNSANKYSSSPPLKKRKLNDYDDGKNDEFVDTMYSELDGNINDVNLTMATNTNTITSLPPLSDIQSITDNVSICNNQLSLPLISMPSFDNKSINNVSPMSFDTVSTSKSGDILSLNVPIPNMPSLNVPIPLNGCILRMEDCFMSNIMNKLSSSIYFNDTTTNNESNTLHSTGQYIIDCKKEENAVFQWTFTVKTRSNVFNYGIGLHTNSIANILCYGWASCYNTGYLVLSSTQNKPHNETFNNDDTITMIFDVKSKRIRYCKNGKYTDAVINNINTSYQYKMAVLMAGIGQIQMVNFQKFYRCYS